MPHTSISRSTRIPTLVTAALVVLADLLSKWFMVGWLHPGESRWLVSDQIGLQLVHNRRFAFSLGPASGISSIIALIALSVVAFLLLTRPFGTGHLVDLGTGLILGGAIGNTIDRIARGYVVDFFAVGAFPRFNLADAALTVGIASILLGQFRQGPLARD